MCTVALVLACALACVCAQALAGTPATPQAQPRPPAAKAAAPAVNPANADAAPREIAGLIAALGASGCEFQRNGSWHDAAAARAHLQRKYDYLRKRDLAPTAELFIERAATRSSMSGKAYRVRCPGRAEQPAADWFLQRLRASRTRSN